MKYFTDTVDYPKEIALNILPMDTLWCYISSTFLDGFINYVKVHKAVLLNRYEDWDAKLDLSEHEIVSINSNATGGGFKWENAKGTTKNELFHELTKLDAVYHPKMKDLQDDVLILAKVGAIEDQNVWMLFWFDLDCSDCCIGRFSTTDSEEEVTAEFLEYARTQGERLSREYKGCKEFYREIPNHYFRGWLAS